MTHEWFPQGIPELHICLTISGNAHRALMIVPSCTYHTVPLPFLRDITGGKMEVGVLSIFFWAFRRKLGHKEKWKKEEEEWTKKSFIFTWIYDAEDYSKQTFPYCEAFVWDYKQVAIIFTEMVLVWLQNIHQIQQRWFPKLQNIGFHSWYTTVMKASLQKIMLSFI